MCISNVKLFYINILKKIVVIIVGVVDNVDIYLWFSIYSFNAIEIKSILE